MDSQSTNHILYSLCKWQYQSHTTEAEREQSYLKERGWGLKWVQVEILRLRHSWGLPNTPSPFHEPYSGSKHPTTYSKYKLQTFTPPPQPGEKYLTRRRKEKIYNPLTEPTVSRRDFPALWPILGHHLVSLRLLCFASLLCFACLPNIISLQSSSPQTHDVMAPFGLSPALKRLGEMGLTWEPRDGLDNQRK